MQVYQAIAHALRDEGIADVFGLMGDGNLKLVPYLTSELGLRFYSSRHEQGALAMADGYARVTGRVGVCTVTQGPGLTNTLTALVAARKARTPMVLLAGDTATGLHGHPQYTDQDAVFAAAGVPVVPLRAESAAADVVAALRGAVGESRPVGMSMKTDVQDLQAGDAALPPPLEAVAPAQPDADAVRQVAELLASAERPAIVAGRGAVRADARTALEALGDQIGAVLADSLPAKSFFAGNPWDVGIAGGFSSGLAVRVLRQADVVLVFGASLNHFTTKGGTLFSPSATLVHIDASPDAIGAFTPASAGVVGDAALTAEALTAELRAQGPSGTGWRTDELRAEIAAYTRAADFTDESTAGVVDPRTLSLRLDELLPANRQLITDGGHFCGFPAMYLSVPEPRAFVFALDFGAVGLGLGSALGAAVGRPDRLTVLGIGDGGLLMSLPELDTAVRYRIPIVIVVYNDAAYGAEMHFLRMLDLPDAETVFATPSFARIAEAVGAEGMALSSLDDLDQLAKRIESLDGPLVVDCAVNRDVRAGWLEEAFLRAVH